jgi:hypothetical protein
MPIDSQSLAGLVTHLGGTPVEHKNFRFEIELGEVRRVVPEIIRLGDLQCVKVDEYTGNDFNGKTCSIAVIEIQRRPEKSEYEEERGLMSVVCR